MEPAHFDWRWPERPALASAGVGSLARDPLATLRRVQVESIGMTINFRPAAITNRDIASLHFELRFDRPISTSRRMAVASSGAVENQTQLARQYLRGGYPEGRRRHLLRERVRAPPVGVVLVKLFCGYVGH